jgi:hypothetical protein
VSFIRGKRSILTTLYEGEGEVDQLHFIFPHWLYGLVRQFTVLTNQRILQNNLFWFLSRQKVVSIDLDQIDNVWFTRRIFYEAVFVGIAFMILVMPIGYLIFLIGLFLQVWSLNIKSKSGSIRTHILGITIDPRLRMFFDLVQQHVKSCKSQNPQNPPPMEVYERLSQPFFSLSKQEFWGLMAVFVFGILQRFLVNGVISTGTYLFTPLLFSIPVVVGCLCGRWSGFKVGIFGFTGLITLITPLTFSIGISGLKHMYRMDIFSCELIAFVLLAGLAGYLSGLLRRIAPLYLSIFSSFIWVIHYALFARNFFKGYDPLIILLFSAGISGVLVNLMMYLYIGQLNKNQNLRRQQ